MSYISNHTADIAIKARQRATLEAEYEAYIKQRRPNAHLSVAVARSPKFQDLPPSHQP